MKNKKQIKAILFGLMLALSSSRKIDATEITNSYITSSENEIFQLINGQSIPISPGEKNTVKSILINIYKPNTSLEWLKEYSNLEQLVIHNFTNSTDLEFLNYLSNLKSLTLHEVGKYSLTNFGKLNQNKNLTSLELYTPSTLDLNMFVSMPQLKSLRLLDGNFQNYDALKKMPNLNFLRLRIKENLPENLLESLTNLKKLKLDIDNTIRIDYKKLTFLEELSFGVTKPYTIPVDFTNEDYNTLEENNVKITSDIPGTMEKVKNINNRLDFIIRNLNIMPEIPEEEKLSILLGYVTSNLTYDQNILEKSFQNLDTRALAYKFYEQGLLYGTLEYQTAICGNYASLFQALANRIHLKSYYVKNENHAWNLVEIDEKYYYVDSTLLDYNYGDNFLKIKDKTGLKWYMEPFLKVHDSLHTPNNLPNEMVLENQRKKGLH